MIPTASQRTTPIRLVMVGMLAAAAVWRQLPVHPPIDCPLRATTGIPCPMCGMTRATVAFVHGEFGRALSFNPAVLIVVVAAVLLIVAPKFALRLRPPVWVIATGLGLLWIWNLGFNPTFHQWLLF